MEKLGYRFSFGPWNIHEGADPFGPPVRSSIAFADKLKMLKEMGFDSMQFHDDDAVPDIEDKTPTQIEQEATIMRQMLEDHGLFAEFAAPRIWEDPHTIDGAFTSNSATDRQWAKDRLKKCIDVMKALNTDLMVLWLAREGTYLRESKDPVAATNQLIETVNTALEYDPDIRIAIEPKPNEPMDLSYLPTIGHALALGMQTSDPSRVGALVESAHAILAGLDPSDEMAFALAFDKLYSVHLNDQNGLKYDQDRSFGSVDLRRAFNQVRVLERHNYKDNAVVGLDVKAMRTQPAELATKHLSNSMEVFLRLVEVVRSLDEVRIQEVIDARDYEELDMIILNALLG